MQSHEELAASDLPKIQGKLKAYAVAIVENDFDYIKAYKQVYTRGGIERALDLISNNVKLKGYLQISAARLFIAGKSLAIAKLTAVMKDDSTSVRDKISASAELRKRDEKLKREELEENANTTDLNVRIAFDEPEEENKIE